MSVKSDDSDEHTVMSEINTTPLVDIMLVLLIIFLITIPIITKTVPLHLPKVANIPTKTRGRSGGTASWCPTATR
jgi:biopolymer transport protein ExbD